MCNRLRESAKSKAGKLDGTFEVSESLKSSRKAIPAAPYHLRFINFVYQRLDPYGHRMAHHGTSDGLLHRSRDGNLGMVGRKSLLCTVEVG